jgi:hypothetical protein
VCAIALGRMVIFRLLGVMVLRHIAQEFSGTSHSLPISEVTDSRRFVRLDTPSKECLPIAPCRFKPTNSTT